MVSATFYMLNAFLLL